MPWVIEKRGDEYCVFKQAVKGGPAVGGSLGCHPSRDAALPQLRALYASERTAAGYVEPAPTGDEVPPTPADAVTGDPLAAGVALVAGDTGRVLMIQRALIDGETAGGLWEFPGGKIDEGETPWDAAQREFSEEAGHELPEGVDASTWVSPNGVYRCFVRVAETEDMFPLHQTDPEGRTVENPDNPEGSNYTEAMAWFDPAHLKNGPKMLRPEVRLYTPWKLLTMYAAPKPVPLTAGITHIDEPAPAPAEEEEMTATINELDSLVASMSQPAAALLKEDPLDGPTPWTIKDDGTADGHLALWASCHVGYPGCVTPPRERSFDFYNLGDAVTADGRHVPIGKVTIGCGHAGPELSWRTATAHYDESGTAVAVAHATPDRWGIRLASVLVETATGAQIDEARRSPLSGDWRRINGDLRLVASLGVNVPGYPIPRALVAAGEVQSMFLGFNPEDLAAIITQADSLAASIGLDPASRAAAIRESLGLLT